MDAPSEEELELALDMLEPRDYDGEEADYHDDEAQWTWDRKEGVC